MKYFACIWLLVIAVVFVESKSMELPSNFKTCKRGAPNYKECFGEASANNIMLMADGLKEFKILPLEPVDVNSITIGGSGGAVSLKQIYKNLKIYGVTKGLKNSDFDPDFDKLVFRWNSYNPQIDITGDYTLEGKILLLPLTGHGYCNITMVGLKTTNVMYGEKYEKDGETFMKIKKYIVTFEPNKGLFQFENLFNGDAYLSEQMNKLLNENSDLFVKELKGPFAETFGILFKNIANGIFSHVPLNKIFLTEQ